MREKQHKKERKTTQEEEIETTQQAEKERRRNTTYPTSDQHPPKHHIKEKETTQLTSDAQTDPTSTSSKETDQTRAASTSIHYLLTPSSPLGAFHRNRGRTVHTLHKGRARYVIIHADEVAAPSRPGGYDPTTSSSTDEKGNEKDFWTGGKARVETFVVGQDVMAGERLQWIVEGGKYKASFLLEDAAAAAGGEGTGCLISETVVPGFEFADHDFMKRERAEALLTQEQVEEMGWMLRKD